MKKVLFVFISTLTLFPVFGQITQKNNALRNGDEIIKQQVEYKSPGRSGEQVIWDFSKLKTTNDEYKLSYASPWLNEDTCYVIARDTIHYSRVKENDLIISTEHYTNYFYQVQEGKLWLLGHRNAVSQMYNKPAIPQLNYPFNYGDSIRALYASQTIYSGTEKMPVEGDIRVSADAQGTIILPGRDTLHQVLRVKSIQTIREIPDSGKIARGLTPLNIRTETHKWYAPGYRYPVFETIENINVSDTAETTYYSTSFYYPPADHYYLDTDTANQALIDSIANHPSTPKSWAEENFSYNYYPNPIQGHTLYLEYLLKADADISISLHSSVNGLQRQIPKKQQTAGLYTESIDLVGLTPGTYILRFHIKDETVSDVILKR
jgi:hypothetical protein